MDKHIHIHLHSSSTGAAKAAPVKDEKIKEECGCHENKPRTSLQRKLASLALRRTGGTE